MNTHAIDASFVLAADEARYQALYAHDVGALAAILHENYVHMHANGKGDTKESFLDSIRARKYRFVNAIRSNQIVRQFGQIWILSGATQTKIVVGEQEKVMNNAFSTVWEQQGNSLKLIHWQATPLAVP